MGRGGTTVSVRIGVFGAPGTGKSTLVAALVQATATPTSSPTAAGAPAASNTAVLTTARTDDPAPQSTYHTGLLAPPEAPPEALPEAVATATAPTPMEHTVILTQGGTRAEAVVVDVPGVLCTRDTFGETLGRLARAERRLQGDDDDSDSENEDSENDDATDSESGASLAMVCDAVVLCYDAGAPDTLDAAADLLALLAAARDPLPVRGVLCATHADTPAAAPRAARRRALAAGTRLAAHSGLAHCTAAARDPASAAACFRAAVAEAQRAIPTSDDIAAEQCCRDLHTILCSCTIA